jgi:energy-coupling factor transporter ATP-binding protein EcfA2
VSVIDSISEWANTQAPWLKLATNKLLNQAVLQPTDKADILALLRAPQTAATTASPVATLTPLATTSSKVSLVEIKNATKVNALAADQVLTFGREGVTVVFGENGAGKSGYSRILKNACQARDRADTILSNVFADQLGGAPLGATIKVSVDGQDTEIAWTPAGTPHPSLKKVAVFDAHCARFYIDGQNDVVYQPYGLDVFIKLVQLCGELKASLSAELAVLERVPSPAIHFQQNSKVKDAIVTLSADTALPALFQSHQFGEVDERRRVEIEAAVATIRHSDPKNKIESLRRLAERIGRLLAQVATIKEDLGQTRTETIRLALSDASTARAAASLASAGQFASEPLAGVGEPVWKVMFLAAKEFSEKAAYSGHTFPHVDDGSRCPLCLQELGTEAKTRLSRFAAFLQDRTQEEANSKEAALNDSVRRTLQTPLAGDLADELFLAELGDLGPTIKSLGASANARLNAIKSSVAARSWTPGPALSADPTPALTARRDKLAADAHDLEKNSRADELAKLEAELAELAARKRLHEVRTEVESYVSALQEARGIKTLIAATDTTGISRKASKLTEEAVTETLAVALVNELKNMGITHYEFELDKHARAGVTKHQLRMKTRATASPEVSKILSEGEQRVVSIASFLAELSTSDDTCGIVFDDPVSSLDHQWRSRIAARLATEGKKRQVVVFTHDIYFLLELMELCGEHQVPLATQSLTKISGQSGRVNAEMPWVALKAVDRVRVLEPMVTEVEQLVASGDNERARMVEGYFYDRLRTTWERAVEELVFNRSVIRFKMSVETQRLQRVVLDDADFVTITNNMSLASRRTPAHDAAGAIGGVAPNSTEMAACISAFKAFAAALKAKQNAVSDQRQTQI